MDLHPEDLIEREISGGLSPAEQERLEIHAQTCSVCRLERLARADFRREMDALEATFDVKRLIAAVTIPPAIGALGRTSVRASPGPMRFVRVAAAVLSVTGLAAAARWAPAWIAPSPQSVAGAASAAAVASNGASNTAPGWLAGRSLQAPEGPSVLPEPPQESSRALSAPGPVEARRASVLEASRSSVVRSSTPVHSAPHGTPDSVAALRAREAAPAAEAVLDAQTLFRRANAAREKGDHARAGGFYRRLFDDFTTSPEALASLPIAGRMLLDDGDASGALRHFEDSLRLGSGAMREDVMLGRALALQRLGRSADEAAAWSALLDVYPSSVHADRARARLSELGRR